MLNLVEFYIVNSKAGEHETDIWKVVSKLFDVSDSAVYGKGLQETRT